MAATETPAPGDVVAYGGATAPTNWLLCDGASYTTAGQAALFAVIGYTYGGVGANFNVPDLRQRFSRGAATPGATAGAIDHTHTGPTHSHTVPSSDHGQHTSEGAHTHASHNLAGRSSVAGLQYLSGPNPHNSQGAHPHNAHSAHTGQQADSLTPGATGSANPPFQTVNYIIHV